MKMASVCLAPKERAVRCAQAAGETMPANLSEGVFWHRCSDCGGVCCESQSERRGESVDDCVIEMLTGVLWQRLQARKVR
jgi:hypothetical protein